MRPSAQLERFRMALEVIANGAEWEPGTKIARLAILPPEVSREVTAITADIDRLAESDVENPYAGMSVNEAVEEAREAEPEWKVTTTITPVAAEPEEDDEPEPVDLAELDRELDEEAEAEQPPAKPHARQTYRTPVESAEVRERVLALIREHGEIGPKEIRDELDLDGNVVRYTLKALSEAGLVTGHGTTVTRVYRPARQPSGRSMNTPTKRDRAPAPEPVVDAGDEGGQDGYTVAGVAEDQRAARLNGPGTDEGRLLESVRFKPGWSIGQHAGRLDLHADKVSVAMRKLELEGEVKSEPRNGRVVWVTR